MLRFRRDRLYIGIDRERLTLVRLRAAWGHSAAYRVVDHACVTFDDSASDTERASGLATALSDRRWQETAAHIVLEDRLARYFIAERPVGARSPEEIRLAARLRFEDIFGEASDAWETRLDMPPFATRQLGCGVRKDVLTALTRACTEHRIRVTSLVPFAVAEYNRWHRRLTHKHVWLIVIAPRGVWIGQRYGDDWASANQYASEALFPDALTGYLAQETLRSAADDRARVPPQHWIAGDLTHASSRQRVHAVASASLLGASTWPGQSAEWSATYRLALSSVWPTCV